MRLASFLAFTAGAYAIPASGSLATAVDTTLCDDQASLVLSRQGHIELLVLVNPARADPTFNGKAVHDKKKITGMPHYEAAGSAVAISAAAAATVAAK